MRLASRARVLFAAGALASGLLVGACGSGSGTAAPNAGTGTTTTQTGPEGLAVPTGTVLSPVSTTSTGLTVDGIQCATLEQLAHQVEVHLEIYVHGHQRAVPGGVGIVQPQTASPDTGTGTVYTAGQCYYWLHTDAGDGVVQVDSPVARTFTLGNFFDVWGVALNRSEIAGQHGPVTAIVDGRRWRRGPRAIPLNPHTTIELALGRPVPRFRRTDWGALSGQPLVGG